MRFSWDPRKADSNFHKHGVAFDEAITVFADPLALIFDDLEHSVEEHREIIIGYSTLSRLILVCFVERMDDTIRMISARRATKDERKNYEKNVRKKNA
ncbi:MAG TPA: BrnT family toxin [Anaerolineales bacterium]|nr:BrnT family toxin [Anaerolineales bacterium]HNQ94557.1 BrnT family toxin [Anaerolineales bacterium]HNS62235.1 BrnT family toxin [Anaerolineales bacterium]